MLVSGLISAVMQVMLSAFIPLLCWLIFARKKENFFKWVGLKKPEIEKKPRFFALFTVSFVALLASGLCVLFFFIDGETVAASQFYGAGAAGLLPALIYAFIQTGLSEEIIFRGFIGKRAVAAFGFNIGNGIQALLFGLMHGIMFYPSAGMAAAALTVIFTGAVGAVMGYLNEKTAKGSIIPSWIMHGLANLGSAAFFLFSRSTT